MMMEFYRYGLPVTSIFELTSREEKVKEKAITDSVGWVLARCEAFLKKFVSAFGSYELADNEISDASIHLQAPSSDKGHTDIEVYVPDRIHIIIEAKRGWTLPEIDQLQKYLSRFGHVPIRAFVVLTEASYEYKGLPEANSGNPCKALHMESVMQSFARSQKRGFEL